MEQQCEGNSLQIEVELNRFAGAQVPDRIVHVDFLSHHQYMYVCQTATE